MGQIFNHEAHNHKLITKCEFLDFNVLVRPYRTFYNQIYTGGSYTYSQ